MMQGGTSSALVTDDRCVGMLYASSFVCVCAGEGPVGLGALCLFVKVDVMTPE